MPDEEYLYVECQCHSMDHVVRFTRFDDGEYWLHMQMTPWGGFFRRLWRAIKYVCGKLDDPHWGETILSPENRQQIVDFLNRD